MLADLIQSFQIQSQKTLFKILNGLVKIRKRKMLGKQFIMLALFEYIQILKKETFFRN